jgi:general L-amino acid transport system substrate-binding protein
VRNAIHTEGQDDGAVDAMRIVLCRASSLAAALGVAALLCAPPCIAGNSVLEKVRAREYVVCGVGENLKGYSTVNSEGVWSGIGVDFCRALAAAALGTKDAVKFRATSKDEGFAALQSGEVDVLSGKVAMTATRDMDLGIRFPGVLVFGGQGFMVRKSQAVASALELSGTRICVLSDTDDAQGIGDYFGALRMPFELSRFERWQDATMAYVNKGCQVLSGDIAMLALARQELPDADDHIILPEIAARQTVGPAIRQGDDDWFSVVRWTIHALVAAEELGITSANVEAMKGSANAQVRRFLGLETEFAERLGLAPDWTQRVIKQVGNYGEVFERDLGAKSALKLERRLNNLAGNGGLLYAPPVR